MNGRDVVLQAHTGSGKTLAFGIPLLSKVNPLHSAIQAVVVVPTRELGLQVASVLKQLASSSPQKFSIMSVVDGSKNKRQTLWAVAEPPHIVVGNPSALQRLVDQGSLKLSSVDLVVVDEVDACFGNPTTKQVRIFDLMIKNHLSGGLPISPAMSVIQELHKLLSRHLSNSFQDADSIGKHWTYLAFMPIRMLIVLIIGVEQEEQLHSFKPDRVFRDYAAQLNSVGPYRRSRQIVFCSATIPQRQYFAQLCFRNGWSETIPDLLNVSEDCPMPANIDHEAIVCSIDQRIQLTAHLLKEHFHGISSSSEQPKCIVFVDKEEKMQGYAQYLVQSLRKGASSFQSPSLFQANDFLAILSNDMNIDMRRRALEAFKYSNTSVLLSGGLATRGLDIPAISLVVQVSSDVPLPVCIDCLLFCGCVLLYVVCLG